MAELIIVLINELTGQQTVAVLLVVVIALLTGGSLWLAWLMRGKRRQAEALRVERQTLLESQLAALQQMREAGLAEGPPEDDSQQAQPEG